MLEAISESNEAAEIRKASFVLIHCACCSIERNVQATIRMCSTGMVFISTEDVCLIPDKHVQD